MCSPAVSTAPVLAPWASVNAVSTATTAGLVRHMNSAAAYSTWSQCMSRIRTLAHIYNRSPAALCLICIRMC